MSKTKKASFGIEATDENIKDLVLEAINNYGTGVDLNFIDTSKVTNMSSLFDQEDFEGDVSHWDVSRVTDMSYMFFKCEHFRGNLENWDTGNVTNMSDMFYGCTEFDGTGLENWDLHNLEKAEEMFEECVSFDIDLKNWQLKKLKEGRSMFKWCKEFKGNGLDQWNPINLRNMSEMFSNCAKFNADLSNWTSKIEICGCAFHGTLIKNDKSKWPVSIR